MSRMAKQVFKNKTSRKKTTNPNEHYFRVIATIEFFDLQLIFQLYCLSKFAMGDE